MSDEQVDSLADALEAAVAGAGTTTFHRYPCRHDPGRVIGVQRTADFPSVGITTSVTFGLAHEAWADKNFPDRVELVQGWVGDVRHERLLTVVAETILRVRQLPKPGIIYQDAARSAGLSELQPELPHALVLFPYLWEQGFDRVDLDGVRVWFLQVVPLYEDEKQFIEKQGFSAFEEILSHHGVRFEDPNRMSHMRMY